MTHHVRKREESHGPPKLLVGLLFVASGVLLSVQLVGKDIMGIKIPSPILEVLCAAGSIIGGLYIMWRAVYRERIYV